MRSAIDRHCVVFVTAIILISGCGHSGGRTNIALPEARNTRLIIDGGPDVLVVITHDPITNQDNFELDGVNVPRLEIYDRFRESNKERGDLVLIKAASDARYGSILTAMDAGKSAGFSKFAFVNRVQGSPDDASKFTGFQKSTNGMRSLPPGTDVNRLQAVEIEVTSNNRVYVDRKLIRPEKLYSDIDHAVAYHRARANRGFTDHISLVADQDASWATIVKILDAARRARDDDVGFVTQ